MRVMALHLLHGTFHITICQAVNLSDDHRHSGRAPKFVRKLIEGVEDVAKMGKGFSRLYATIDMERARVGRTRIIKQEPVNPVWNESFHIYCAFNVAHVVVSMKNDNPVGATLLGRAKIPVSDIMSGAEIDRWYDLYHDTGEKVKGNARVHLRMQYFDISQDPFWGKGVSSFKFPGVPYTYMRHWRGCKVTLYQDAHVLDSFAPTIYLDGGRLYKPHRCWEDIFEAISNARHLIYITGWSVYTKIELVRDEQRTFPGIGVTLGDLLKRKADEGV
eukprot:c22255_g3_i1 orf=1-819(-)